MRDDAKLVRHGEAVVARGQEVDDAQGLLGRIALDRAAEVLPLEPSQAAGAVARKLARLVKARLAGKARLSLVR